MASIATPRSGRAELTSAASPSRWLALAAAAAVRRCPPLTASPA